MNIAIFSGNTVDAQLLRDRIKQIDALQCISIFSTTLELIQSINAGQHFDLVFCDAGGKTPQVAQAIQFVKEKYPHSLIILILDGSGLLLEYSEYVWRYELKPFNVSKLKQVLVRAQRLMSPQIILLPCSAGQDRLVLNIHSILFFEMFDKCGVVHTTQKAYPFRSSLTGLEQILSNKLFFKPHKSFLVNVEHIKYINETTIYMEDDSAIPVSRNRKNALYKLLSNHTDIIFA